VETSSNSDEEFPLSMLPPPVSQMRKGKKAARGDYAVGDSILIRYTPRRKGASIQHYVGIIRAKGHLQGQDSGWEVECLRSQGQPGRFIFPPKKDKAIYTESDICMLLSNPKIVNNVHYFSDDLSHYSATLH
jgi:hypothetical protein